MAAGGPGRPPHTRHAPTQIPSSMNARTHLGRMPAISPIQVAMPTRTACWWLRRAMNSPIAAPTSGMNSTPTMPMKMPATVPIAAPITACRLAPARLAPSIADT